MQLIGNPGQRLNSARRNPVSLIGNLWRHRELIFLMTTREMAQRHRGTYLGLLWSFIMPFFMLCIYTLVFSLVLKAKWGDPAHPTAGMTHFAITLFAGLIPFNVFSETVLRAPTLVLNAPNYVKKVVFPLEILPVVTLGAALFHSLISAAILWVGTLLLVGSSSPTVLFLPLAYIPLILLCLGLGWFLASLGVYLKDIRQSMEIVVQILFFTSPIFYPETAVPESFRFWLRANPLTEIIGGFRKVLLWQEPLNWQMWALWTGITLLLAVTGYVWFMKTKSGFADVM
jgi:lipopolysaccharide transport system permease protein